MEWYIILSIAASVIGVFCSLWRCLRCFEDDEEENISPISVTVTGQNQQEIQRIPSYSTEPPPYPADQFKTAGKKNASGKPTPYTINQSFASRINQGFQ